MNFWEFYQKIQEEGGIATPSGVTVKGMSPEWEKYFKELADIPKCRVLYVGGISSKGWRANMMKNAGYEVVAPDFPDSVSAVATGRLIGNSDALPAKIIRKLSGGVVDNQWQKMNDIADIATEKFEPDIIVGTSQGGPVAMRMSKKFPKAQLILLAPAWKIFNQPPDVKSDTIVIHGRKDKVVPYQHSVELCEKNNCRLIWTDDGHDLTNAQRIMMGECEKIAEKLKKYPGVKPKRPELKSISAPVNPSSSLMPPRFM